jgi:hypothetical protein
MSDVTFDMKNNQMKVHQQNSEPWMVTLVDENEFGYKLKDSSLREFFLRYIIGGSSFFCKPLVYLFNFCRVFCLAVSK